MGKAIGIDLGTFNSAGAVALGRDNTEMVLSIYGESIDGKNFPSFVLFDYNGRKQKVGKPAKEELDIAGNHKLVIWGVKRLVGLSYETAKKEGELERFKYDIESGPGGSILIKVGEERFNPSHILEFILREIKENAENENVNSMIGENIERAVISVPAYFDGTRIGNIKEAATKAGFKDVETIPEPTAAAMVYGLELKKEAKILTFDIGAGTLDVTLMQFLYEGDELICSELATSGNPALGGIDMDKVLLDYIIKKYKLRDVEKSPRGIAMLNREVEKAKIKLSSRQEVEIDIPQQSIDLTRKELEEALKPLLDKCRGPIRVALEQASLRANDIDHILFVGGPTYMPCVRAMVKDELKNLGAKKELLRELETFEEKGLPVNPMECVAKGAALKAAKIAKPTVQSDPNAYGTELWPVSGLPNYFYSIIPSNSNYPITRTMGIIHYNPEARSVPIPLVKKLPYYEGGQFIYKYYHLGNYDCYIKSTGDNPEVDIAMELTPDKILVTTFIHKQTGKSVTFEKLDELNGKEITLQDHTPPSSSDVGGGGGGGDGGGGGHRRREWTQQQLEQAIHAAQRIIGDFTDNSQDDKVIRKKEQLLNLIQNVKDAANDTPDVLGRIQELLNALRNAHVINEDDFHAYQGELKNIERNG
jgi:molecular chaperone DnaK (HSP70)